MNSNQSMAITSKVRLTYTYLPPIGTFVSPHHLYFHYFPDHVPNIAGAVYYEAMTDEEKSETIVALHSPSIFILSGIIFAFVAFDVLLLCCLKCRDEELCCHNIWTQHMSPSFIFEDDIDEEQGLSSWSDDE